MFADNFGMSQKGSTPATFVETLGKICLTLQRIMTATAEENETNSVNATENINSQCCGTYT